MRISIQRCINNLEREGYVFLKKAVEFDEVIEIATALGSWWNPEIDKQGRKISANTEENRSTALSTLAIPPHTEGPHLSTPPDYVMFWAERPAKCGGGSLSVTCLDEPLSSLTMEQLDILKNSPIAFYSFPVNSKNKLFPVAERIDGQTRVRYSDNFFRYSSLHPHPSSAIDCFSALPIPVQNFVIACRDAISKSHTTIVMPQQSLLIVDNRRTVHSRNAFTDLSRLTRVFWLKSYITR